MIIHHPAPVAHATTTGMTGHGFYNANSAPQWQAIERVLPLLDAAIGAMPLSAEGTIRLADFGCSEGQNSIAVLSRAVREIRKRTDRPIQTIHSDLPTSDFSRLFLQLRPCSQPVFTADDVYSSAVGGSMFDQLLPPQSLHLATTFNAIGFLSRRPLDRLPGYILPNGPSKERNNGSVSDDEREVFSSLAKTDVAAFLRARAQEIIPGGKLLVEVFGATDTTRTSDGIYDLLNDAVLGFVESADISPDTYERYYQPVYMRTLDELTAPLSDPAHGIEDFFNLDQALSYEVPVPFNDRYRADGDLERYAKDYVNFLRAFTEAVLAGALGQTEDSAELVQKIYDRAESLLKANPERYPFRYAAVAMLLTRSTEC